MFLRVQKLLKNNKKNTRLSKDRSSQSKIILRALIIIKNSLISMKITKILSLQIVNSSKIQNTKPFLSSKHKKTMPKRTVSWNKKKSQIFSLLTKVYKVKIAKYRQIHLVKAEETEFSAILHHLKLHDKSKKCKLPNKP